MVNRPFPWQWVKWVGLSNNQEYKNVRNAAALYAKALNTPNSNAVAKAQKNAAAKANLNNAVNRYLKRTPGGAPPPAPARPGFFSRFRRAPGPALAPGLAPPTTPTARNNNRAPNTGNWESGKYRIVNITGLGQKSVYKFGTDYYYSTSGDPKNNNPVWAKVKRDGNSNKFNRNTTSSTFYKRKNATSGKVIFVNKNAGNKSAMLTNWLKEKKTVNGLTTANNLAKAYLNGESVPANLRNFTGNMNKNRPQGKLENPNAARNRDEFWAAVSTEMARRAAAKGAFNAWYANNGKSGTGNTAKANAYAALIKIALANPTNASKKTLIINRRNNVKNGIHQRDAFWNAVNAALSKS